MIVPSLSFVNHRCAARYGEHKYMTVNGVRIHYVESGDVSKPLLLFVHGWPQFWYSWRNQIEYFNKVRVHFVQQTLFNSSFLFRITMLLPWT